VTTNIQLARQVARHVQLKYVTMKSAHIESALPPDQPVSEPVSINQQHRCSFDEKLLDDRRDIHVTTEFRLQASKNASEKSELVKLEVTFVLVYTLPLDAKYEPHCVQHFAELNGVYNAWPYWREIVQSATGRVGLGGIMVPVYRPVSAEVPEKPAPEPVAKSAQ